MMKKLYFFFCFVFIFSIRIHAQFVDNFTDGDFTNNPTWVGNTADWVVNTNQQLQSNNTVANSTFYLSTTSTLATTAEWSFYNQITFNPSSANYIDIFLTASASDITLTTTTGYFVRIGGTDDEISLFRKDATGVVTKIIDGVNGILNTSNNIMKIKVIRNAANQWTLLRDLTGSGNTYSSEGSIVDATFTTSSFFGILVKQSTVASFAQRHFFDDFVVKTYVPDITPPNIISASAINVNSVDVLFNEPVDFTTSQVLLNYVANNGLGQPISAVRDAANTSLVHLVFSNNIPNGVSCTIIINGVKDLSDNAIVNGTANFSYYLPQQYDVVIDEIMADYSPQVALPANEWIELKNTSAFSINLLGWHIADATNISGAMPNFVLKPDSTVIVCSSSYVTAMATFGSVISVTSFPSLNDDGDQLTLTSAQSKIIHNVNYTSDWYQNELKKGGGWSLEMIDSKNPCSGSTNWKASVDIKGGTPGKKNSIDAINKDITSPQVLRATAIDNVNIVITFDEPLDSLKASTVANYSISDGVGVPLQAIAIAPTFNTVSLKLATPLIANKIYMVTVTNVTDCSNNVIGNNKTARVGLPTSASNFNVVINEILFNPKSNGADYVEIYNNSNKIIDLKNTFLANRNTAGAISSITQLSSLSNLLFPKDFMVATTDINNIKNNYITLNPSAFVLLNTMPSMNDDKGDIILLNEQGLILDEIVYSDKWHFKLLDDHSGVSLERIDYNDTTKDNPATLNVNEQAQNWHSAATSVGYGTPTYKNSQFKNTDDVVGEITVSPEIVSPDNDGFDDFATINYAFPTAGYVANITIFDAAGRPVRYLQRSALSGTKGYYRWDGLGEKNQQLATGIYIIYTEVFNLVGKKKTFKNVIVVARKNR